jgi:hypothetical protein
MDRSGKEPGSRKEILLYPLEVLAEAVMFHPGRTRYNYRRAKTRQNSGEEAWIY